MTLLDRIKFQRSIFRNAKEVWLPADQVIALIKEVEAARKKQTKKD